MAQRNWGFDILNVPATAFVSGGRAWQLCRREGADPNRFGLGPDAEHVRGWWFIRERLLLDIAALNKVELLCWDSWEGLTEGRADDEAILDEIAVLSLNPDSCELLARCATDPRWQIPSAVQCFHPITGAFVVDVA